MLYLKSCPRCSGDVQVDDDSFGGYARCLQCGFVRDLPKNRNQLVTRTVAPVSMADEVEELEEAA